MKFPDDWTHREQKLFLVMCRGTRLVRGGHGSYGVVVERAARDFGVTLTAWESSLMLQAIVKASLL